MAKCLQVRLQSPRLFYRNLAIGAMFVILSVTISMWTWGDGRFFKATITETCPAPPEGGAFYSFGSCTTDCVVVPQVYPSCPGGHTDLATCNAAYRDSCSSSSSSPAACNPSVCAAALGQVWDCSSGTPQPAGPLIPCPSGCVETPNPATFTCEAGNRGVIGSTSCGCPAAPPCTGTWHALNPSAPLYSVDQLNSFNPSLPAPTPAGGSSPEGQPCTSDRDQSALTGWSCQCNRGCTMGTSCMVNGVEVPIGGLIPCDDTPPDDPNTPELENAGPGTNPNGTGDCPGFGNYCVNNSHCHMSCQRCEGVPPPPAVCGNGVKEEEEECDAGNDNIPLAIANASYQENLWDDPAIPNEPIEKLLERPGIISCLETCKLPRCSDGRDEDSDGTDQDEVLDPLSPTYNEDDLSDQQDPGCKTGSCITGTWDDANAKYLPGRNSEDNPCLTEGEEYEEPTDASSSSLSASVSSTSIPDISLAGSLFSGLISTIFQGSQLRSAIMVERPTDCNLLPGVCKEEGGCLEDWACVWIGTRYECRETVALGAPCSSNLNCKDSYSTREDGNSCYVPRANNVICLITNGSLSGTCCQLGVEPGPGVVACTREGRCGGAGQVPCQGSSPVLCPPSGGGGGVPPTITSPTITSPTTTGPTATDPTTTSPTTTYPTITDPTTTPPTVTSPSSSAGSSGPCTCPSDAICVLPPSCSSSSAFSCPVGETPMALTMCPLAQRGQVFGFDSVCCRPASSSSVSTQCKAPQICLKSSQCVQQGGTVTNDQCIVAQDPGNCCILPASSANSSQTSSRSYSLSVSSIRSSSVASSTSSRSSQSSSSFSSSVASSASTSVASSTVSSFASNSSSSQACCCLPTSAASASQSPAALGDIIGLTPQLRIESVRLSPFTRTTLSTIRFSDNAVLNTLQRAAFDGNNLVIYANTSTHTEASYFRVNITTGVATYWFTPSVGLLSTDPGPYAGMAVFGDTVVTAKGRTLSFFTQSAVQHVDIATIVPGGNITTGLIAGLGRAEDGSLIVAMSNWDVFTGINPAFPSGVIPLTSVFRAGSVPLLPITPSTIAQVGANEFMALDANGNARSRLTTCSDSRFGGFIASGFTQQTSAQICQAPSASSSPASSASSSCACFTQCSASSSSGGNGSKSSVQSSDCGTKAGPCPSSSANSLSNSQSSATNSASRSSSSIGLTSSATYSLSSSITVVSVTPPTTINPTTINPTTTNPSSSRSSTSPTTTNPSSSRSSSAPPTTINPTTTNPSSSRSSTSPTTTNPSSSSASSTLPTTINPTTTNPSSSASPTTINPTTINPTVTLPTTTLPTTIIATSIFPTTTFPTTALSTTTLPVTNIAFIFCGDFVVQPERGEQCDLGRTVNGSAASNCTSTCQLRSLSTCGNGTIDAGEECDDGNTRDFDACSGQCRDEQGRCGDGKVQKAYGEECDEGEQNDGTSELCDAQCKRKPIPTCGDGVVDPESEECDDGLRNADSSDATCLSNCLLPYCGDTVVGQNEQCDDGNLFDFDGCSHTCERESSLAAPSESPTVANPLVADLAPPDNPSYYRNLPTPARSNTGPGLIIFIASGAAAGIGLARRRMRG